MKKIIGMSFIALLALDAAANTCKSTIEPGDTVAQVKESMQCWKQAVERAEAELKLRKSDLANLNRQLQTARSDAETTRQRADMATKRAEDQALELERLRAEAGKGAKSMAGDKPKEAPWQVLTYLLAHPSIDQCKQNSARLIGDLPDMRQRSQTNQYVSFADAAYSVAVYCLSNGTLVLSAGPVFERVKDLSQGIGKKLDAMR